MNLKLKKTPMPTAAQPMASLNKMTPAKSKFGGELSDVSMDILRDLHAHPDDSFPARKARITSTDNLASRIAGLVTHGYVARVKQSGRTMGAVLTNKGRMMLGLPPLPEPQVVKEVRICNASMRETLLDLSRDVHMGRIGLAMCGAGGVR
jgi:hypothetical protein